MVFAGVGTLKNLVKAKEELDSYKTQIAVGAILEKFFNKLRVSVRNTGKVHVDITDSYEEFAMIASKERGRCSRLLLGDDDFEYNTKTVTYLKQQQTLFPLHSALMAVLPDYGLSLQQLQILQSVKANRNLLAHPVVDRELVLRCEQSVKKAYQNNELAVSALIIVLGYMKDRRVSNVGSNNQ